MNFNTFRMVWIIRMTRCNASNLKHLECCNRFGCFRIHSNILITFEWFNCLKNCIEWLDWFDFIFEDIDSLQAVIRIARCNVSNLKHLECCNQFDCFRIHSNISIRFEWFNYFENCIEWLGWFDFNFEDIDSLKVI